MSSKTMTRETKVVGEATDQVAPAKPQVNEVLEQVRRDSCNESAEYLNESEVPHGGE